MADRDPVLTRDSFRPLIPPLMETVLGGESMAARSKTLALPWFARSDYPALLDLFTDANKLPTTYDAWLVRAERIEWQFQKAGFGVAKIWIRPRPFAAWCKERNVSPGQAARLTFANEAARHPRAQP
jgi:hypothetical protein